MNTNAPKPSPLGRGLSALFGDTDSSYAPRGTQSPPKAGASAPAFTPAAPSTAGSSAADAVAHGTINTRGFRRMSLGSLEPGAFQPRRHFDEEALKGLADSIRERGVLEPLLVRPVKGRETCEIVAGERRWRAAQLAGVHDVPVIVREMTDKEALEFGLIENVQRQDLSPLEEAEGYRRLMNEFNHTQDGLAKVVGKSRPHITNMLRILSLPDAVKQMITQGDLTFGHARALITAKHPAALAEQVAKKGLNVRQVEALVKREHEALKPGKTKFVPSTDNADVLALEKELERVIGLKVKIQTQGKAGSLTLFYQDLDQLDDVIKRLRG